MTEQEAKWPQSIEAERSVLGGVLLHPASWGDVEPNVAEDDFHHPAHRPIFEAMMWLAHNGQPIDTLTVSQRMKSVGTFEKLNAFNGADYLLELQTAVVAVENIAWHARLVATKARRRKVIRIASELQAAGYADDDDDTFLSNAQTRAMSILDVRRTQRGLVPIATMLKRTITQLQARCEARKRGVVAGIPTGFLKLDSMIGGWRPGEVNAVGARPKVGKTSFVLATVIAAARAKYPCAVFSAEMPGTGVLERALQAEASIEGTRMRHGALDQEHWKALVKVAAQLAELGVWIDDDADVTIQDIRARARRWRADNPDNDALIAVDYIQLVKATKNSKTRDQEVTEVTRGLKAMSKELGASVIALASLNREAEKRDNKRPRSSDLRESGSIESDADSIILMHREELYSPEKKWQGIAEFIIDRNRFGPTGTVKLRWVGEYTRFETLVRTREDAGEDDDEES